MYQWKIIFFVSVTSNFYSLSDWDNGRDGGDGRGIGVRGRKDRCVWKWWFLLLDCMEKIQIFNPKGISKLLAMVVESIGPIKNPYSSSEHMQLQNIRDSCFPKLWKTIIYFKKLFIY